MAQSKKNDEGLEKLGEFIKELAPHYIKIQELNAPNIRRSQWMSFIVMMSILLGTIILAYYKIIDSSAATGLIGAVIGYVFGHIYSNKQR